MSTFIQCPTSNLDYTISWSQWLEQGDRITQSVWISETGLTLGIMSFTDNQTLAWLTGGTVGTNYTVTNTVTTQAGRVHCQSIVISVR